MRRHFERRTAQLINGFEIWSKSGSRESDWELAGYIDFESDGLSPYERKQKLDGMRAAA